MRRAPGLLAGVRRSLGPRRPRRPERGGDPGYRILPFLEAPERVEIERILTELDLAPDLPFHASPAAAWNTHGPAVDGLLKAACAPAVARLLPGHRIFLAGTTYKGVGGYAIPFHQDWTYTDERTVRTTFIWCPLVDTAVANGGLRVIPGSHLWTHSIRPGRRTDPARAEPEPWQPHLDALAARALDLEVPAGSAVVFDPAILHASGPNLSGRPRPAFTLGVVPTGAELVHFHQRPGGPLEGFPVDDAFFSGHRYGCRPEGAATVTPWAPPINASEAAQLVALHLGGSGSR